MLVRNIGLALVAITQHKIRALLTALGIVFGVAAVIAMLAIGRGAEVAILEQLKYVGTNNIILEAVSLEEQQEDEEEQDEKVEKRKYSPGLNLKSISAIQQVLPTVKYVSPELIIPSSVIYKGKYGKSEVYGISNDYFSIFNMTLEQGRIFNKNHIENGSPVCIIGKDFKTKFFKNQEAIGEYIKFKNVWLKVIGVLDKRSGDDVVMPDNSIAVDDLVFVPIKTALGRFENRASIGPQDIGRGRRQSMKNYHQLDRAIIHIDDNKDLSASAQVISKMLDRKHNKRKDVKIGIPELLIKQQQKTQGTFNLVLAIIAGISLLVGGIGIMNIMLASVLERISEIGLRRSLGATEQDIRYQFLFEAVLICLFGGLIGVLLGVLSARFIAQSAEIPTVFEWGSVLLAFGVAVATGVIFWIPTCKKSSYFGSGTSIKNKLMMMIKQLILFCILFLFGAISNAQKRTLTIDDVINMAQGTTQRTILAKTELETAQWSFAAWKGGYKPKLTLTGNLPSYTRSLVAQTQDNGQDVFVSRSVLRTDAALSLSQIIPQTGTRISTRTELNRIVNIRENADNNKTYLFTPISLGVSQDLFSFNTHKWQKKIRPLQYEEATKVYNESMERLAFQSVVAFFDYYLAQLNYTSAVKDKANSDTLLNLSQNRFGVGRIGETDLLQFELNVHRAVSAQARAKIQMENTKAVLKDLIDLDTNDEIVLQEPPELPLPDLDEEAILASALENMSTTTSFRRRLLVAQRNVDEAKKSSGLSIDLSGNFGLSQNTDVDEKFNDLVDQEQLRVGVRIPIADWGQSKAEREIAQSQLRLTKIMIEQEELQFERDIRRAITQLKLEKENLDLAKVVLDVADKRLDITRKRYLIGKIAVLDLNQAIDDREANRVNYIQSLRSYWQSYFRLRNITLYNIRNGEKLEYFYE